MTRKIGSPVTIDGDITLLGTNRRILVKTSNAPFAERFCFQTLDANNSTIVQAIPSGTGNNSGFACFNNSNPDSTSAGTSILYFAIAGSAATITVSRLASSGTYPTLEIVTDNSTLSFGTKVTVTVGVFQADNGILSSVYNHIRTDKSTNFTATSNSSYWITGNSVTATLPASPTDNDIVTFANKSAVTGFIVGRNGNKIMGLTEDLTVDMTNFSFSLVYVSATTDWRLV